MFVCFMANSHMLMVLMVLLLLLLLLLLLIVDLSPTQAFFLARFNVIMVR